MIYWMRGGGNNWWQAFIGAAGLVTWLGGISEDDCMFDASCSAYLY
jgi:hypothetical protein